MQKHSIVVLAAVSLASVLAPSVASADGTVSCKGATTVANPKGNDVAYSFGCNQSISGFAIVTSQEIDSFSTRSELVNRSDGAPSEEGKAYECEGLIPGDGFSCVGGDQPNSTFATGTFTTVEPACHVEDRSKSVRAWLVVSQTEGEGEEAETFISHPFALKKAKCPKPKPRRTK